MFTGKAGPSDTSSLTQYRLALSSAENPYSGYNGCVAVLATDYRVSQRHCCALKHQYHLKMMAVYKRLNFCCLPGATAKNLLFTVKNTVSYYFH
ncbi:hypothetical protein BL250_13510 [Erwinia sp. OLTSP20]|nr:hypothetical protein BV501_16775 [Erwinia sp. OAMSP11]PIJ69148.1 hypothetical protein BK416_15455 [Erwinia sp. OLSSP12]PIJ78797.1 hypothetical protein BLD47_16725 [Erwinia sp. OLCASP19]PIJ81827.1 hypothetical protein BLD46_12140 [Erwinia sp. OLMTSP26]PIJ82105.1 hypothetical protein BLD49_15765 [Erwinia sp. OLMDSP33]PIJ89277.1 hypothetical protein BL249_16945 [Erwinia sp. OLFS4]PIJ90760.1 hypothetical protein BL250_13510 [Erwinia sp. OLTSP20]